MDPFIYECKILMGEHMIICLETLGQYEWKLDDKMKIIISQNIEILRICFVQYLHLYI